MKTLEVLSPAGDQERLEAAVRYGADAVYLGGAMFGMRAASANFTPEKLKFAVDYAHKHNVQVYLTCNTLPTNAEVAELPEFLKEAANAGVDALIVADIGILMQAKRLVPELDIHISTQAGVVNYLTANELFALGASRVVLARELSMDTVRCIRDNTPPELEIEVFVHGAMCMSFSGRCLLSNYLIGRDANRGACAQPCRWGYHLMEEKRPGQYFPIFEDESGSYILNAKDLCMVEHIDKLAAAGVTSLKIEGRAKSAYYVATITNAYRGAVDHYFRDPENFKPLAWTVDEVRKVSHREYSTGFFFDTPDQRYEDGGYVRQWDVVGVVAGCEPGKLVVSARNKFSVGEMLEAIVPGEKPVRIPVEYLWDEEDQPLADACHPMRKFKIAFDGRIAEGIMLRREVIKSSEQA